METKQKVLPLLRGLRKNTKQPKLAQLCKELLKEAKTEVREHSLMEALPHNSITFMFTDFWEVGGHVVLLYCAALFQNTCEREQCVLKSEGQITFGELDQILIAASRPSVIDEQTRSILSKVCSSDYFVKEDIHQTSRVLMRLNEQYDAFAQAEQPVQQEFMTAYQQLLSIYEAADFLHFDWRNCNRLNIACTGDAEPALDKFNVDPMVLLRAIPRCTILAQLTCLRPHQSLLPHAEAVMVCIEHAILWLKKSPLRVFYPLELTYADISGSMSDHDQILLEGLWNRRCPSGLEAFLRRETLKLLSPYRRKWDGSKGKLCHLKAEDYDPRRLFDISKKDLAVIKMMALPYRTKISYRPPELKSQHEHQRDVHSDIMAEVFREDWRYEPPEYDHLFEHKRRKRRKKQLRRQLTKKAKLQKLSA